MDALFPDVLRMSAEGSLVILVVAALRLILKRAPKRMVCLLWLLAGLRLLLPFQIESAMSLQPRMEPVTISQSEAIPEPEMPQQPVTPDIPVITPGTEPAMEQLPQLPPMEWSGSDAEVTVPTMESMPLPERTEPVDLADVCSLLWAAGVTAMAAYTLLSYWRLKRKVSDAVILEEGVWVNGSIDSPFLLGFLRPRIYLPAGLSPQERRFVLAHERVHQKRKDHWWKLLGFAALSLHWFNPLVWLGYVLLCRDLEMACDEAVVAQMGLEDRKAYSYVLVTCAAKHHSLAACPVAFGEVSIKERVKHVLKFKKPGFWITLVVILAAVLVAVFLLTSPGETEPVPEETVSADDTEPTQEALMTIPVEIVPVIATQDVEKANETKERLESAWNELLSKDHYHLFFADSTYQGSVGWQVHIYKKGNDTMWLSSDHITREGRMVLDGTQYKFIDGNDGGWVPYTEDDPLLETMLAYFSLDGKEITDISSDNQTDASGSAYEKLTFNAYSVNETGKTVVQPMAVYFDSNGTITGMRVENTDRKGADIFAFTNWSDEASDLNNAEDAFQSARENILSAADVHPSLLQQPTEDEQRMKEWGIQYRVDDDRLTRNGSEVWFCQSEGYDMAVYTDSEYWLEKKTDTGWEKLDMIAEPQWDSVNYTLGHGMYSMVYVDWSELYGPLPSGTYRMGKRFTESENSGQSCVGYAEFTIYYNEATTAEQTAAVERCYAALEELKQRDHIHYLSTSETYSTEEVWWHNEDYLREGKWFWTGATGVTKDEAGNIVPRVDISARMNGIGYSGARENPDDLGSNVMGMELATLSANRAGWVSAGIQECGNMLFFERGNKLITFPEGIGIISDEVVRFQQTWPVQGMEVSEYSAILTYRFDKNGDLCYMEYKTDRTSGVISIEVFDTTAAEIDAIIKPYTENLIVDAFSWEEAKAKYTAAEFNIREKDFVNNGGNSISDPVEAAKLALKEYPNLGEYLSVDVSRDDTAGMWKVTIEAYVDYQSTYAYRDIYLSDNGATQLLVYEGPIRFDEARK